MVEPVRYGPGGVILPPKEEPKKVEPVVKTTPTKKQKKSLQEIYGEGEHDSDGFDEEHDSTADRGQN